jgi:hypothetical protein
LNSITSENHLDQTNHIKDIIKPRNSFSSPSKFEPNRANEPSLQECEPLQETLFKHYKKIQNEYGFKRPGFYGEQEW